MDLYCFKVDGLKPGECLGVLDSYTSLNFTKSFQGCGSFTIKGNFTKGAAPLLQVGNLVYINRRNPLNRLQDRRGRHNKLHRVRYGA